MSEAGSVKVFVRAAVLALLLVAIGAGQVLALESPYVQTGSIKAFDADGNPIAVSYYDRVGSDPDYPVYYRDLYMGATGWVAAADGGPVPLGFYTPSSSMCDPFQRWPYSMDPDPQDDCWTVVFNGGVSSPGTYGINVPLTTIVNGETQVFDHWTVANGIVDGHCRAGDVGQMGIAYPAGDGVTPTHKYGAEYRVWTDIRTDFYNQIGMDAAFEAHYARVSPDTTAPLLVMGDAIECATVERGDPLVPAFSCSEPGGLGSGVASCILVDESGVVAQGASLDTSTVGTHTYRLTATDTAGNTRSRSATYTVVEGTTTLSNSSLAENLPAGTAVGDFDTSNADEGESWTYELVAGEGGDDNASFTIDGATLRTAEEFDFEVRSAYSVRVRVTETATDFTREQVFPITIEDLLERFPTALPIAENQPAGTIVTTLIDASGPANYGGFMSLVAGEGDDDNALFAVQDRPDVPLGYMQDLVTTASFDYETRRTYHIRLQHRYNVTGQWQYFEYRVKVAVTDVNDPPVAQDAQVSTVEDVGYELSLLPFVSDQDGDELQVTVQSVVPHGMVSVLEGVATYVPDPDYHGLDSFEYRVCDPDRACDTATVEVVVSPVNDPPTVVDDEWDADEDVDLEVPAPGVLANDTDPEGDELTVRLVDDVDKGFLLLGADGSVYYDGPLDFFGDVSFTYEACDPSDACTQGTGTIHVHGINDAPVSYELPIVTQEDTPVSLPIASFLYDAEDDPLTLSVTSPPAHGEIDLTADTFTYTPHANYSGQDFATWQGCDDEGRCAVVEMTIGVLAVNDVPVAEDDSYDVTRGESLSVDAPGVLGNDSDVESSSLTAKLVEGPASGAFELHADGSFSYTPPSSFVGGQTFTYRANDGAQDSAIATVTIEVTAPKVAPVARDDAYSTDEDTELVVSNADGVLANDTDANDDALTATLVDGPRHGALDLKSGGGFRYTPDANYNGADSFTYKASDGELESATKTVRITVRSVNDLPTIALTGTSCTSDNQPSGTITVLVSDIESAVGSLVVTASLPNAPILPKNSVKVSGSGATRTITADAKATKEGGSGVLRIIVSDKAGEASTTVNIIVGTSNADTLTGTEGVDMMFGLDGVDTISGAGGADIVCGGKGNDVLRGGDGPDILDGGSGADTLEGGAGDDTLLGGDGADVLRGQGGADTFTGGAGKDVYEDFSAADGDSQSEKP
jgi:VCBS repeat-containing protein